MRCPYCGSLDSQVKDSRPAEDGGAIRRRRVCPDCGGRFTTFERVQLRELVVVKKSGRRVAFDRDKLARSVQVALRKRAVDPDRIERMISGIVRQLESTGESDIQSDHIGLLVMEALRGLDDVAYVRFASVYRDFREAKDFAAVIGELAGSVPAPDAEVSLPPLAGTALADSGAAETAGAGDPGLAKREPDDAG
ncbi:transcriptional regulator NrdR [Aureimonas glaciei]|uniref:Transcriptional repressor NrdR n=1 Tax=Aureimonas glaciei TaxID=1776957 RepID=A0A916XV40_9HYPH|nr:transcriptional regulator NrdR [Aureimonas glaciei]GGD14691.1 transcriptional repressor NrdR [Aureimonas glaciei]